jgi:hypothetical protein
VRNLLFHFCKIKSLRPVELGLFTNIRLTGTETHSGKPGFTKSGLPNCAYTYAWVRLPLSYWNEEKWRIHIPTNGAKTGFSGCWRDYTEVSR